MSVVIDYQVWRVRAAVGEAPGLKYLWARDPDPAGPFAPGGDCSGFCHWLYAGLGLPWVFPQTDVLYQIADRMGRLRPPSAVQPGWMLIHRRGFKGAGTGHVAAFVGDEGHGPETIEAHSSHTVPQVGRFPADPASRFEASIAIVEIGADLSVVAQFVNACRATTISAGMNGPVVKFLQQELNIVPQDGNYGAVTTAAVTDFQVSFRGLQVAKGITDPFLLLVTGICDPHTWAALALKEP